MDLVRSQPAATFGCLLLLVFVVIALLAPVLAPYGRSEIVGEPFGAPSSAHPLGLDDAGHDMLSLMIYGTVVSLGVGFAAATIALVIGTTVGIVAGYTGGWVDGTVMRVADYFLVIPILPLMIVVAALWSATLLNVILIIGLLQWPYTARVIRSQVLSLRDRPFIRRTVSLGASHRRTVFHHILPQIAPLLAASAAITIGGAIFFEAALSFLGLGPDGYVSWGKLISSAYERAAGSSGAWWAIVPPGIAIGLVVLGCTLVARAIESALNPRLSVANLGVRHFRIVKSEDRT